VRDTEVTNGNKPHHVYFVLVEERTCFLKRDYVFMLIISTSNFSKYIQLYKKPHKKTNAIFKAS
jgi:hypothetical protein